MTLIDERMAEVQLHLAREGLLIEHVILNAATACDWKPEARGCFLCLWHDLDRLFPA